MTEEQATVARVKCGAAWLDGICPNWFNHIDCDTLALENPFYCVLGQLGAAHLTPSYNAMSDSLVGPNCLRPAETLQEFGFTRCLSWWPTQHAREKELWALLTKTWCEEIATRMAWCEQASPERSKAS